MLNLARIMCFDDLLAFKNEMEVKDRDIDAASFWYDKRICSRKMGLEERTPLLVASLFRSSTVVKYILESDKIDVNRTCGSDKPIDSFSIKISWQFKEKADGAVAERDNPKGDYCDYAHGVFESWLHPAQCRTRLCNDETRCACKVCFFAYKPEKLRPVYALTGLAMSSPKSYSLSGLDMSTLSPLSLSSPSVSFPVTSTPPMSPLAALLSPVSGDLWQSKVNKLSPPMLQLPESRLKTTLSARDLDLEMELLGLESQVATQQHQLMEKISHLCSPSSCFSRRIGEAKPTNLDDVFGSLDPALLS